MRKIVKIFLVSTILIITMLASPFAFAKENNNYDFDGEGTIENPYLVENSEDLIKIKNLVNVTEDTLDGLFFKQTQDIDLNGIIWEGIGNATNTNLIFRGIYNGDGHRIYNIETPNDNGNYGFFSNIGGICFNLGIESGIIYGNASGSIASHSPGDGSGLIFNCYNKATIKASRAGGITDNFQGGRIANCVNLGNVYGNIKGGITTIGNTDVIYSGSIDSNSFFGEGFAGTEKENFIIGKNVSMKKIADKLNSTITLASYYSGMDKTLVRTFVVDENGNLCFGELYKANFIENHAKTLYWLGIAGILVVCVVPFIIVKVKKENGKNIED